MITLLNKSTKITVFASLLGLLAISGCDRSQPAREAADITASGSSTVFPLTREAARRFERANSSMGLAVEFTGTTGGFRKFCAGETDINSASRPINDSEHALCEENDVGYLELPIAMDAIAIVVHPANNWAADISIEELRRLWAPQADGTLTSWQQVRPSWPDRPIKLFGRGQDSGTYDYFTTVVVGETRSSRKDYVASEDEEQLANQIATEPDALGFFGIGAYHRHWDTLKLLAISNGSAPVFPSLETVMNHDYFPLARPLYLYINQQSLREKPALRDFSIAYLDGIRSWIHFTGFMPLNDQSYENALSRLRKPE